jgi:hypothetical protein
VIVALPPLTPYTTPDDATEATVVSLEDQLPPPTLSVRDVVAPTQTEAAPVIAGNVPVAVIVVETVLAPQAFAKT